MMSIVYLFPIIISSENFYGDVYRMTIVPNGLQLAIHFDYIYLEC